MSYFDFKINYYTSCASYLKQSSDTMDFSIRVLKERTHSLHVCDVCVGLNVTAKIGDAPAYIGQICGVAGVW